MLAYTELNDPFDQRMRFEEQANQKVRSLFLLSLMLDMLTRIPKAQGDDEAQLIDE